MAIIHSEFLNAKILKIACGNSSDAKEVASMIQRHRKFQGWNPETDYRVFGSRCADGTNVSAAVYGTDQKISEFIGYVKTMGKSIEVYETDVGTQKTLKLI